MQVSNCDITHSATNGQSANWDDSEIAEFRQNLVTNNQCPVSITATHLASIGPGNDFSGNTENYVKVPCTTLPEGGHTWLNQNIPVLLESPNFGITRKLGIGDNCDVSVEPGFEMHFASDVGISVFGNRSLSAVGSPSDSIIFRGEDALAGAWRGIEFSFGENVKNRLDYVQPSHAGSNDWESVICMWADPRLSVTNSSISDIDGCAYRDGTGNGAFENPNFCESNNALTNINGNAANCY